MSHDCFPRVLGGIGMAAKPLCALSIALVCLGLGRGFLP